MKLLLVQFNSNECLMRSGEIAICCKHPLRHLHFHFTLTTFLHTRNVNRRLEFKLNVFKLVTLLRNAIEYCAITIKLASLTVIAHTTILKSR